MTNRWTRVADLLEKAVADGVTPSAALAVGSDSDLLFECCVGTYSAGRRDVVGPDTVYDLSSLTKPLATTALLMQL